MNLTEKRYSCVSCLEQGLRKSKNIEKMRYELIQIYPQKKSADFFEYDRTEFRFLRLYKRKLSKEV